MKVKSNPDTKKMDKPGEAYKAEDKAPKRGVKAQDQDEYDAKGYGKWDKSVSKSKARSQQEAAPTGRGNRGPSQKDGGPIANWDKSVEPHGQYAAQEKAPAKGSMSSEKASLGFKLESETSGYLGHFADEKYLRQGHNDWGSLANAFTGKDDAQPAASPAPTKNSGDEDKSGMKSAQDSMRKAFNYSDD